MEWNLSESPREVKHCGSGIGSGPNQSVAREVANKSSDFSATVTHFPLRQISALRRRGGAKVVGDLLAGEISAVGILLRGHLSGKVTNRHMKRRPLRRQL